MIMKVLTILMILFSLTFVSAIQIYSGESVEIELDKPYAYYSIVGNSTEVVLNITQNGNNLTITPDKYSLSDSYELIFFDIEKETITIYSSGGGSSGGSRTIYKDRNVTEYIETNVTKYINKEIEKEIEVEKIVEKVSWWVWFILAFLVYLICHLIFIQMKGGKNKDE